MVVALTIQSKSSWFMRLRTSFVDGIDARFTIPKFQDFWIHDINHELLGVKGELMGIGADGNRGGCVTTEQYVEGASRSTVYPMIP